MNHQARSIGDTDPDDVEAAVLEELPDMLFIDQLLTALLASKADDIPKEYCDPLLELIRRNKKRKKRYLIVNGVSAATYKALFGKALEARDPRMNALIDCIRDSACLSRPARPTATVGATVGKRSVDAATDTDDLAPTVSIATITLPIESTPSPASHNNDDGSIDDGSIVDDESVGGDHESSDDEDDDNVSSDDEGRAIYLLSDSAHASAATECSGVRRSTRQRPAPQAPPPSPEPNPKKAKSRRKRKGKKKTMTTKAVIGKDTATEETTTDDGADEGTAAFEGRDLARRLEQLELSPADIENVESTIEELQQKLDELGETDGGVQGDPPKYIADEIAIIKMMVEVLKQFRRGNITTNELKQSIADFVMSLEPYQEVVEQLLVLENKTIDDLKSEQSFNVRGKTLGEALKNTEKDGSVSEDEEPDQTEELVYARGVVENAQKATETSSNRSLLDCLRLRNTMRNTIRFILNFRVAIDILEGGTIADFFTTKKDKNNATKLAKDIGAVDCASDDCNAMTFITKVIFQCREDNSSTKVELILAIIKGMRGSKRNAKLKGLYGKAATLDIITGEYKGESDYFDGKDGEGRINLPSVAFTIVVLGTEVDQQLVKLQLLPISLDFSASLIGGSIRTIEKIVGFLAKPQFWTGNFDTTRGARDRYKLTQADVVEKLGDICTMTDEKMDDYQGKYMLMHVNATFLESIIRFHTILCASLQVGN